MAQFKPLASSRRQPDSISRRTFLRQIGLAAAAASHGFAAPVHAQRRKPNIVLLVLDTFRRSHLSCHGFERRTTPFLEQLAEHGRLYANAYSTSAWTLPAHASMLTGLYPISHGAHHERYYLEPEVPRLPGILRRHGYRTACLSENAFVAPYTGFKEGFEQFRNGPLTVEDLARQLRSFDGDPFFLFINLLGGHQPYCDAGPFTGMFLSDEAYRDKCAYDLYERLANNDMPAKWLKHLKEHYHAKLRHTDALAKQFAAELKKQGLWDGTVFMVTSDHGENLGDHGLLDHQLCLYETLIQVPLIIQFPDGFDPGSVDDRVVQLPDLFPTLLELAEIDAGGVAHQGESLLATPSGDEREVFCELYRNGIFSARETFPGFPEARSRTVNHPNVKRYDRRLTAITRGGLKLIAGSDGSLELYDLRHDPDETHNLASDPARAGQLQSLELAMARRKNAYRAHHPPPEAINPPAEQSMGLLEALGYL